MCNEAPAARAMLNQANALWPARSKASDGICPSAAHTAANPDSSHEVGNAVDLTHDPAHGVDCAVIAQAIIGRKDPRVKYLIFNDRIAQARKGWVWEPYQPTNPKRNRHTDHLHVDIYEAQRGNTDSWFTPAAGGIQGAASFPVPIPGSGVTVDVDPGAVASEIPGIGPLVDFVAFISDGKNWLRVASFVGGLVMVGIGGVVILSDTRVAKTAVGAYAKVQTAGAVDLDGPTAPAAAAEA